ncbi:hypothetical protein [Sphingobacterium siyangense]|uniref:hypothetical protein n=1 Tax=Sphingobacterium siyangense TaxID=459529 RepID=UPI0028AB037D|nr:hypothetical protein [Sphingobacterium siyangense]
MLQKKYSFNYCIFALAGFGFLYFILPLVLQSFVGPEFYIFSKEQNNVYFENITFYLLLVVFLFVLSSSMIHSPWVVNRPTTTVNYFIIAITFIYLIFVFGKGLILSRNGVPREELLEIISSQLVPGFGYLLLACFFSIIRLRKSYLLVAFGLLALSLDVVYQGKIFVTNALMLTMFFLDNNRIKLTFFRVVSFVLIGFGFLAFIFILRSFSAGENNAAIGVYTYFSEFMGVNATSGWAKEYAANGGAHGFFNFDPILQKFYIGSVGHGLAISPVAYFIGNFGDYFYLIIFIYFLVLFLIFYFSSYILGRFCFFILVYNFIHLLRHGPDIFLYKCFLQLIIVSLAVLFINFFAKIRFK